MDELIIDPNGLIIYINDYDAKHDEDVRVEIQHGPMKFRYDLDKIQLDEFCLSCYEPTIDFDISDKTANRIFDLLEGRKC
jgi:hypothetical protein